MSETQHILTDNAGLLGFAMSTYTKQGITDWHVLDKPKGSWFAPLYLRKHPSKNTYENHACNFIMELTLSVDA